MALASQACSDQTDLHFTICMGSKYPFVRRWQMMLLSWLCFVIKLLLSIDVFLKHEMIVCYRLFERIFRES
jgi:hypothetical protein